MYIYDICMSCIVFIHIYIYHIYLYIYHIFIYKLYDIIETVYESYIRVLPPQGASLALSL